MESRRKLSPPSSFRAPTSLLTTPGPSLPVRPQEEQSGSLVWILCRPLAVWFPQLPLSGQIFPESPASLQPVKAIKWLFPLKTNTHTHTPLVMHRGLQMEGSASSIRSFSGVTRWNESETKHSSHRRADRQLEMNLSSFNLLSFSTCRPARLPVRLFLSPPLTLLLPASHRDRWLVALRVCLYL